MKLLIDTHVFLWLLNAPQRVSEQALEACVETDNQLVLSVASLWEIQIKAGMSRLRLETSFEGLVNETTR